MLTQSDLEIIHISSIIINTTFLEVYPTIAFHHQIGQMQFKIFLNTTIKVFKAL